MNEKKYKLLFKPIWRIWYGIVTRRDTNHEVKFMNYGYLGINKPELLPHDEIERYPIQLYDYLAGLINIKDKKVLEVGCGRGGGSSYLTRYHKPASYHAIDLSDIAIEFCRSEYKIENLTHLQGDAQELPFDDNSFDVIINVESSHCYPDINKFFDEVSRVLKPGGHFLYTDLRNVTNIDYFRSCLAQSPLVIHHEEDITSNVYEALKVDSARREAIVKKLAPMFMHSVARLFAGVKDSKTFERFENRWYHYFLYVMKKD
jgi:ubiquinone/menaquinone biosynthesis C-methylase UbiE